MKRPVTLKRRWVLSATLAASVTVSSGILVRSAEPVLPPLLPPLPEKTNTPATAPFPILDSFLKRVKQEKPGTGAAPAKPDLPPLPPPTAQAQQPTAGPTPGAGPDTLPQSSPQTPGAGVDRLPAPQSPAPSSNAGGLSGAGAQGVERTSGLSTSVNAISANQATQADVQTRATTDVGDLLGKSQSITGVETQKRQPVANEARIRGFTLGQTNTYADGAFWFPARQDLDTFLSKIDSGIVQDVIVLKGPYSALYGPAFSFIDVQTQASPRYENGFNWEGRSSILYKTNGEQVSGRQGIKVGGQDWGARVSYGHRTGNDYRTGDGTEIPASYNVRDIDAAVGLDLTGNSKIEFGYLRLDQTNVEFPGQVFDTKALVTNAYRLRYVVENQDLFDRFLIDGFYNRTSLSGIAQNTGKRRQIRDLDELNFIGFTDIDQSSAGYRAAFTWGDVRDSQFTIGTDLRYLTGSLNEFDNLLLNNPCVGAAAASFPVPSNHHITTGGVFGEYSRQQTERLSYKLGGRFDYVSTDIKGIPPGFCTPAEFFNAANNSYFPDRPSLSANGNTDFQRDFALMMLFGTAEYRVNDKLRASFGLGHSQRPPTQTELYALQPFLAVLQNGLTTVTGNPDLAAEKLYQVDVGLKGQYDWLRFGTNGFFAVIEDYITLSAFGSGKIKQGGLEIERSNGLSVRFVNTDYATLAGFEAYTEVDVTGWMTPFVVVNYVEGRDQTRGKRARDFKELPVLDANGVERPGLGGNAAQEEPLPGIPPLEARIGVRFHEARVNPRYGVEVLARAVSAQNRVAQSLLEMPSNGFTVWDIRGFWQWRQGILLTAGVENIFDRFYREHLDLRTGSGVFQPGFNAYFGMEARY